MTTLALSAEYLLLHKSHAMGAVKETMVSEQDLIIAVLNGDKKAFSALIKEHDTSVRNMVSGVLADNSAVDDVLQEAYVRAYRSLGSFKQTSSFKTWLYRIAYNAAIDETRRAKRNEHSEIQGHIADSATVESSVTNRLDVLSALSHLSQAQRTCAVLIDGHGFDYQHVASLLDIPVGTVGSHIHEARKLLRARLGMSEENS